MGVRTATEKHLEFFSVRRGVFGPRSLLVPGKVGQARVLCWPRHACGMGHLFGAWSEQRKALRSNTNKAFYCKVLGNFNYRSHR